MDLNSIIVSQIQKLDRVGAKLIEARKQEAAVAEKKADEDAKRKILLHEEDQKSFLADKKVFEDSFVREIMGIITTGLNNHKAIEYKPLIEKITGTGLPTFLKNRFLFFIDEPKFFKTLPYYYIDFNCTDRHHVMTFIVDNDLILMQRKTARDPFYIQTKREILSAYKEEAAAQIINFLMTD